MSTATPDLESFLADRIAAHVSDDGSPDRVSPLGRLTCTTAACGVIAATTFGPPYQEVARRSRYGASAMAHLIATIAAAEVAKEEAFWDAHQQESAEGAGICGHMHLIETCVQAGLDAVLAVYPPFQDEFPDEHHWTALSLIDHEELHAQVTAAVEAAFDAYDIGLEWDGF